MIYDGLTPDRAREAVERMMRDLPAEVTGILKAHGARIEAAAAPLTPVDTGMLRRATRSAVEQRVGEQTLRILNNQIYARYQHERGDLRHTVGQSHFISMPFSREIPAIMRDLLEAGLKELTP